MSNDQSETQKAQPNTLVELANLTLPKMDLVGPTVDDDIRRAIWRYGVDAVKKAVKEATKAKRGRKREPDWAELRDTIEADAREWLAGNDPFAARSNYAIAKEFSERNPGHSIYSTHKRIERKLSRGPYDRRWFTLVSAERLSRDSGSYEDHIRVLEALSEMPSSTLSNPWQSSLGLARSTVADFEAREGHPPPADMTFQDVENAARRGGISSMVVPEHRGLFGSRSKAHSSISSILSEASERSED